MYIMGQNEHPDQEQKGTEYQKSPAVSVDFQVLASKNTSLKRLLFDRTIATVWFMVVIS